MLAQQSKAYKREKIQKNTEWKIVGRRAHTRTDEQEEERTKALLSEVHLQTSVQSMARRQHQERN